MEVGDRTLYITEDHDVYSINPLENDSEGKWMQKAVEKPGAFRKYCKSKGLTDKEDMVTSECIAEGKKSEDPHVVKMATLAETFSKNRPKGDFLTFKELESLVKKNINKSIKNYTISEEEDMTKKEEKLQEDTTIKNKGETESKYVKLTDQEGEDEEVEEEEKKVEDMAKKPKPAPTTPPKEEPMIAKADLVSKEDFVKLMKKLEDNEKIMLDMKSKLEKTEISQVETDRNDMLSDLSSMYFIPQNRLLEKTEKYDKLLGKKSNDFIADLLEILPYVTKPNLLDESTKTDMKSDLADPEILKV